MFNKINLFMESNSIKSYESRQVWKEAAINSNIYVNYFP